MQKNTPVSFIMSDEVVVANPDHKFSQVQALFLKYNLHHLPVLEEGKLIGIISSSDVMNFYAKKLSELKDCSVDALDEKVKITDLMTQSPITIESTAPIKKAAEIFSKGEFQALPVVDYGEIQGIVTTRDLVQYLLDNLSV